MFVNLIKNDRFFVFFRELSGLLVKEIKDLFVKDGEDKVKELINVWDKFCVELELL